MKSGFALIELLIATMIAGMVSIILLNALSIINRGQLRSEQLSDFSMRLTTLQHQIEQDLMGAFDPTIPKKEGQEEEKKQPNQTGKKEDDKKIDKIFYATERDNNLEQLTFISGNPAKIYWGQKSGRAKARVARIVYRLEPEKEKRESFCLMRQEGDDLAYHLYQEREEKIRPYEVASGIKECRVTYLWTAQEKKEEQGKKEQQQRTPEKKKVNRQQVWDSDKKDEERPLLPQGVQLEVVMWEIEGKRHSAFSFTIPLFFTPFEESKQEQLPQQAPKQDAQKGGQKEQKKAMSLVDSGGSVSADLPIDLTLQQPVGAVNA